MRKVVSFMHVSLDGFVAGPNGELEWAIMDPEIEDYVDEQLQTVGAALYGSTTYGMMRGYWPTVPSNPDSSQHELNHAHWVENIPKIVFSRTLEHADWNNTRIIRDHISEEITALKNQPGGDLMIFGSPRITHTFIQLNLIDEYLININPLLLGSGAPLFTNVEETSKLKLVSSKIFKSGVLGLRYQTSK